VRRKIAVASCALFALACAQASVPLRATGADAAGATRTPAASDAAARTGARAATPAFAYRPDLPLGHPDASLLLNREGSPRIEKPAFYADYWKNFSDDVRRWSRETGISINPNYVLALFAKESGFDPHATSDVPANGVAQMTPIADLDLLRLTTDDPRWQWLAAEARSWPRHPLVHDVHATKARTDSLLRANAIDARTEYFFNPGTESRASMLWLRMLADTWRGDAVDREAADVARNKLNKGGPLTDEQILDLVTVSYNQGYPYVVDLIRKYGTSWTKHLNAESADYLERIRNYTVIFQNAGAQ
jgi:hypothetical protein